MDRLAELTACIESVREQRYEPIEIIVVIDGNTELRESIANRFGDADNVTIIENETNEGISYSRTKGGEHATGEIVAFIDDDAVAEPDWITRLIEAYEQTDALAVGGYVAPNWVEGKPSFFPDEFYWLVGCTERGFAEHLEEVRNTYGSNISYRRDIFLDIGGYDVNTGRKGDEHVQAHEAPVGIRLKRRHGRGMIYVENAVVHHTLFPYRGDFRWLVKRSFWQGYSKRVMALLYPDSAGSEHDFLRRVFFRYVPDRARRMVTHRSVDQAKQIAAIFIFTAAVALGYLYGLLRRDVLRSEDQATIE